MSTVLVTGAAGTVGSAIADRLADDGHRVVGTDLAAGDGIVGADLRDVDAARRLAETVVAEHGAVDGLVNVAGVYGERVPFVGSDPQRWWEVVETDLRAPVVLCRHLVPAMVDRGTGVVVNVTSRAAVWDDPGASSVAYATAKAGLARFTEALAHELTGSGVTVVHASPGMVRSAMTESRPDIDAIEPARFLDPATFAELVSRLIAGDHPELHGHFVHATDDLAHVAALVRDHPHRRRLSLHPFGPDDPVR